MYRRGHGSYIGDRTPTFTLANRVTLRRYLVLPKTADGLTVLAGRPLTGVVHDLYRLISGVRTAEGDGALEREHDVHGDGEIRRWWGAR